MKLSYPVATPDTRDESMLALRGELEGSFRLLADLGYDGVELMLRDAAELDAGPLRALAERLNLAIVGVSTGQLWKEDGLQFCHTDRAARRQAVDRTKRVIDFTAAVGAPQVNIGTLRGRLPPGERDAARQAARESLNELLDHGLARQVGIALEPQNRYVINWLNTVDETLRWMESFPQSNLSLLFDAYHAGLEEASVHASLIRAFGRISHVQVADSNRLAPGWGSTNVGDFLRVLKALGYQRFVSVEVEQRPGGPEAARQAARCLLPVINEN